ncbi:MAG TPA: ABC transporter permease [Gemmatimonadales bacterium]|jgi:spermidine/putrescine transport system permease protein|nr:ABC transporter permease [Gemmatimonadales bacterium]
MAQRLPKSLIGFTAVVYFLLHLPILVLVIFSFNSSRYVVWTGLSLNWYRRLLERPDILAALKASLIVGICSTIVSTILGTLIALALARHRFKGRTVFEGLLYVPIVTPEIVVGISLLILFAALKIPLGLSTITIAHIAFNISFVVVVVLARIQGMDQNLEEAAMNLGADEITTFWKITVPQLWPGILAGGLLAFTMSFDDFVITFFVSGVGSTTLPLLVYGMVRKSIEPSINAISTLILIVTTITIYLADRFGRERARADV